MIEPNPLDINKKSIPGTKVPWLEHHRLSKLHKNEEELEIEDLGLTIKLPLAMF